MGEVQSIFSMLSLHKAPYTLFEVAEQYAANPAFARKLLQVHCKPREPKAAAAAASSSSSEFSFAKAAKLGPGPQQVRGAEGAKGNP
jgi:hypothetical protein